MNLESRNSFTNGSDCVDVWNSLCPELDSRVERIFLSFFLVLFFYNSLMQCCLKFVSACVDYRAVGVRRGLLEVRGGALPGRHGGPRLLLLLHRVRGEGRAEAAADQVQAPPRGPQKGGTRGRPRLPGQFVLWRLDFGLMQRRDTVHNMWRHWAPSQISCLQSWYMYSIWRRERLEEFLLTGTSAMFSVDSPLLCEGHRFQEIFWNLWCLKCVKWKNCVVCVTYARDRMGRMSRRFALYIDLVQWHER